MATKTGAALICGSIAYDTIMVFHDRFKHHILPDKIHILNVSFLVPELRREFGGCAGNIAYNMNLLGDMGYPMATVGNDFDDYAAWLRRVGVPLDFVEQVPHAHTAQAFITTDLDDNQITAFHAGAMSFSRQLTVPRQHGISLGVVAPDAPDAMLAHAEQFADAGIRFLFDPGQNMPLFNTDELNRFISWASWVAVNDYEWQRLSQRTGHSEQTILQQVEALIVTQAASGSIIHTRQNTFRIPAATPSQVQDPTGCGDAYRAGLLHGLLHGLDWQTTGQIAALLGAIKIEHRGTQNHSFDREEFADRYHENFGTRYTF
ncbi:MAG: carbohydrate kinase family protein [Gammaproteobacteria bacterium]|nr:carbohydrate kinase family protein [Gammaproteobacteria bacterium]